ncbi:MAG: hypothetical protein IJK41_01265 [Muribaculaceae bacterium]|nr:hypothetical protein [Muribaculaceae bacterium]
MKRFFIALLTVAATVTALAQGNGRIYIEDFEITPDSTVMVQVMLENSEPTQGFQFNMNLPEGLTLEEIELTKYSRKMKMNQANKLKNGSWIVAVYSMEQTAYPPDTAAVLTLTMTALPDFEGGNINIDKCQGSSLEYTTINYDNSYAVVTRKPGQ